MIATKGYTTAFILLLLLGAPTAAGSEVHHHHEEEEGFAVRDHHEEEEGFAVRDHHEEEEDGFSVQDFEANGVVVETAGPGVVDTGIELPGEVRPNADRLAHVAPRFPGIVREVHKAAGDPVVAGEVLARIESENLAIYELKAAFDGTVIDKHITPGESVTRGRPAYIIADLSEVWVNVNAYQKALGGLHRGQPVLISTADGTIQAAGTISYIAPVVDQATRTTNARVVLPNPQGLWRPGLFVIATVGLPRRADVVVPRTAIHRVDGQDVLFVVEGNEFVARHITARALGRRRAEIRSGLRAGERFAAENSFLVKAELGKGSAAHAH